MVAVTKMSKLEKIIEEYGIMEYLELTVTIARCGRWRGNSGVDLVVCTLSSTNICSRSNGLHKDDWLIEF